MNRRRSGFTLVEMVITMVIVALIGCNISMVMKTGTSAYEAGMMESELTSQTSKTLDRIQLALMSSSLEDLNPELSEGMHCSYIDYCESLGLNEAGELVFADPERIALATNEDEIVWQEDPGGENERSVVWTKNVPDLYRDEVLNGIDDNGNGLLDEEGLFFEQHGNSIQVQLTVQRTDSSGRQITKDSGLTVTCRN
jgi:prepilin-type N-terminal cleavage/methylation domain-containing protein